MFEDLKVGDRFPLGEMLITREDVIAFASKYDPQPYHLDDAAAEASPVFKRLSASGWHTTVISSLLMDTFWKGTRVRGIAGGGADELRWLSPVYPGDTLTGEIEMTSVRVSESKPDRGIASMQTELRNQDGVPVLRVKMTGVFARAPAEG